MTGIINTQNRSFDLASVTMQGVSSSINMTIGVLLNAVKETYDCKEKLIDEAEDMTTQEKLAAHDQNNDCLRQNILQIVLDFGNSTTYFIRQLLAKPGLLRLIRRLMS